MKPRLGSRALVYVVANLMTHLRNAITKCRRGVNYFDRTLRKAKIDLFRIQARLSARYVNDSSSGLIMQTYFA